jgi:uncharacterized membrane protein YcjF (UPF0283 family)
VTEHRGFLDEPAPATPPTSSTGGALERGWIADPHGITGPIRHNPAAVLAETDVERTLTPLAIAVIGLLSLIVGVAVLELGNFAAAQFDKSRWLGWLTVALLAPASLAILWSAIREWRGLAALKTADKIRMGLRSENLKVARTQADKWLKAIGATPEVVSLVLARASRQSVKRQDNDTGSGLTMSNCHFAEPPVMSDNDTFRRLCQRENSLVAVAPADILGIDDVKTALDQPLDD